MLANSLYRLLSPLFITTCIALFPLLSWAQWQVFNSQISGIVSDQTGAFISQATVKVVNFQNNIERKVTTDDEGHFRIAFLPPGKYNVVVEVSGFMTTTIEDVEIGIGKSAELHISMETSGKSETVTVQASPRRPRRKRTKATPGSNEGTEHQTPDPQTVIKEIIDNLPIGLIEFNSPDVMKTGEAETIEVRITQNKNIEEELTKGLKGHGMAQIETIKVAYVMKVSLSGDKDDFQITLVDGLPEERLVSDNDYTQWTWRVLPLKSGKQKRLYLTAAAIIKTNLGERPKPIPTKEKVINVQVNFVYSAKQFLYNYWQFIVTTLIIPLIAWAVTLFRNRGNRDVSEPESRINFE